MMHSNSCVKPDRWLLAELDVFQKGSDVWFQSLQKERKPALFIWSNSDGLQLLLLKSYPVSYELALLPFLLLEFCCAFSIRLSLHLQKAMQLKLSLQHLCLNQFLLPSLQLRNFLSGAWTTITSAIVTQTFLSITSLLKMKCLVLFCSSLNVKKQIQLKLTQTAFRLRKETHSCI